MKKLSDYTYVVMPDDGRWLAYVPAIPSCYAVGESPEEAVVELGYVFDMVLEDVLDGSMLLPPDVKELVPVAVG